MLNRTIPRELPIGIIDFSDKYNVGRGALWVRVSNKTLPKEVMLGKGVVNEAWFLRRWSFMNTVREMNQSLVYLLEEEFSLVEISKTIAKRYGGSDTSIKEYLVHTLFSIKGDEVKIATRVHQRAARVFKYARFIDNKLKRQGSSIEKMLDARMEKHERSLNVNKDRRQLERLSNRD